MMNGMRGECEAAVKSGLLDRAIIRFVLALALAFLGTGMAGVGGAQAQMDDIDRARRMHDRLTGVPPDAAVLDAMATMIGNGRADLAAEMAMQHPAFYNVSLKNFATPWTNEAQTVFAPLNDYTATVIGMIRDDIPFDQILTADMIYTGANGVVSPNFQQTSNAHYEALEDAGIDLSDDTLLVQRTQSGLPGSQLSSGDAAGILTTRAAAEAFFVAGTNRAMWRFTAINYLCRDMEALNDVARPGDRIRQDVTRSPGGDSEIYLNTCFGCHSEMSSS